MNRVDGGEDRRSQRDDVLVALLAAGMTYQAAGAPAGAKRNPCIRSLRSSALPDSPAQLVTGE